MAIEKELEKLLSPEIQRGEVAVRIEPDGLIISLREIGFFDSGSAQIKPQAIDTLHRIAGFLQGRACALRIEGHTDNVPIHTASFASNWELSTARATDDREAVDRRGRIFPRAALCLRIWRISSCGREFFRGRTTNESKSRHRGRAGIPSPDAGCRRRICGFSSFRSEAVSVVALASGLDWQENASALFLRAGRQTQCFRHLREQRRGGEGLLNVPIARIETGLQSCACRIA